jgi:hypothetical protein
MPIERGLQYLRQMQRVTLKNLPTPLEKTEKWKREHVGYCVISSESLRCRTIFLAKRKHDEKCDE